MDIEKLLIPISAEFPCGPDLEYDHDFLSLIQSLEGPQDSIVGEAPQKDPDWNEIASLAETLLLRTKDLRLAIGLTRAWTHRKGLPGLVSGLHLINDLLTLYWEDIHPGLDVEDDHDPTRRLNVLSEIGSYSILVRDAQGILISFPPIRISIRDILITLGKIPTTNTKSEFSQAQIEEMFDSQNNAQEILKLRDDLAEIVGTLQEIQNFLKQKVNEALLPDFKKLSGTLEPVLVLCKKFSMIDQEVVSDNYVVEVGSKVMDNVSPSSEIRNREDVVRILERVCKYIERTEPTNPVSLIIHLAQSLMTKNFLEILEAIPPEDMKVFKKIIDSDKNK